PLLEVANRRERVHPLARCLTDADENACRERDRELARERDRAQAPRRHLVGGTVVRQAGAEQPLRDGLEHQAHAHGDLPKRGEVALGHDAWIGVGQERRLSERELADRAEVAERGPVAVAAQERAVDGKSRLGLVAEREEGLFRTETRARLSERDHLFGRHRVGAGLAGIAAEGAVAAVVSAEGRQGHEDLGREGDDASPAAVAHLRRACQHIAQRRVGSLDQRARLRVWDHCRGDREAALDRGWPARGAFLSADRTSWAKRSMLASTALMSGTVGSKTKCVTPRAAYCLRSAATSAPVPWSSGRSPAAALARLLR